MGFVERAFTPPGSGAGVPPGGGGMQGPTAEAVAPPPTAPTAPKMPAAPALFNPSKAAAAGQRAQISSTTALGAAATAGQTAKKTLLGG